MKRKNDGRGYDLDYYNLYLRRYLTVHHFPEADDDLLIAARAEAATDTYMESRLAGMKSLCPPRKPLPACLMALRFRHTIL